MSEPEEMVTLPREALRALFDLAVNSMNFGSGFWETADTDTARAVAVVLGLDPMEATPSNHRANYEHTHVPVGWHDQINVSGWPGHGTLQRRRVYVNYCKWCSRPLDPQVYPVPSAEPVKHLTECPQYPGTVPDHLRGEPGFECTCPPHHNAPEWD